MNGRKKMEVMAGAGGFLGWRYIYCVSVFFFFFLIGYCVFVFVLILICMHLWSSVADDDYVLIIYFFLLIKKKKNQSGTTSFMSFMSLKAFNELKLFFYSFYMMSLWAWSSKNCLIRLCYFRIFCGIFFLKKKYGLTTVG